MPYLFTLLDYLKLNYIYYPIIMMIVTAAVYKYSYDMLITNIAIDLFILLTPALFVEIILLISLITKITYILNIMEIYFQNNQSL